MPSECPDCRWRSKQEPGSILRCTTTNRLVKTVPVADLSDLFASKVGGDAK